MAWARRRTNRSCSGSSSVILGRSRARAAALEQRDPSPWVAALAVWAVGLAHRELGELEQARRELERAWTSAMELDEHEMAGEIAVSLSLVVAYQGELGNALEILAVSEPGVSPPSRGRLRTQRGMILYEAGHFGDALVEYEAALDLLIASEDALGEARLRTNIGALLAYLGRGDDAHPPAARRRAGGPPRSDADPGVGGPEPGLHRHARRRLPERLRPLRSGGCPLPPQRLRRSPGARDAGRPHARPAAGEPARRRPPVGGVTARRDRRRGEQPRSRGGPTARRRGPAGDRRRRRRGRAAPSDRSPRSTPWNAGHGWRWRAPCCCGREPPTDPTGTWSTTWAATPTS